MSVQQQLVQSPGRNERVVSLERLVRRLHTSNNIWMVILWIVTGLVTLIFVSIIAYLIVQGIGYLFKPSFYGTGVEGVGPEIFNTFYMLVLTQILLLPFGLAAAVYLVEYARRGPLVTAVHFAAETLSGIPSLILGLFGFLAFGSLLHLGTSRLTGALTLLCLNLPLTLRLFEDALAAVPGDQREGSLALGSTRWHMVRTVILPAALPGIITGFILSSGKIIGEAAALIFTMGASNPANVFTLDPRIGSDTLTIHIWYAQTVGAGDFDPATATAVSAGSAALLIIILFVINLAARSIGRALQRRITAA